MCWIKNHIISERSEDGLSSHAFISISKFLTKIDFFWGGEAYLRSAVNSIRLQLAIKNKDSLDIDRATILIEGGNNRNKIVSDELMKVTEDLINIQKKRKDAFTRQQQQQNKQKTTNN